MRGDPEPVPVVSATGAGPTDLDAFDAALSAAGVGDYNLVELSSVLPAGAEPAVGAPVPDWRTGELVATVLAARVGEGPVAAGIGWSLADEGGVFYEETARDATACEDRLRTGLARARERRNWSWTGGIETEVVAQEAADWSAGAAVVVAVYGPLALRDGPGKPTGRLTPSSPTAPGRLDGHGRLFPTRAYRRLCPSRTSLTRSNPEWTATPVTPK
jgi:arginine decarboxylase